MTCLGLHVLFKSPGDGQSKFLFVHENLQSFNMFTRGTVQEAMRFATDTVANRLKPGSRSVIQHEEYFLHCLSQNNLILSFIVNGEYDARVAQRILDECYRLFTSQYPQNTWPEMTALSGKCPQIAEICSKADDPTSVDSMARLQKDLDDVKDIARENISNLLQRGENLEDLVEKSQQLSSYSKTFYKTAKKNNSCCTIV